MDDFMVVFKSANKYYLLSGNLLLYINLSGSLN